MTYFPELRAELVSAAARHTVDDEPSRQLVRKASRPMRLVGIKLAGAAVVSTTALAATGVLPLGSAITSLLSPSANSEQGTAIAGTVRLLPLRADDPAGGAPWGLQVAHTTRGFVCAEVGRVEYGTVGVIGQDGAAANDGHFHPLSSSATQRLGCTLPDAHGQGFVNVALAGVPASGLVSDEEHSCLPTGSAPGRPQCPSTDLRELYYGLLGPDAISLTYRGQGGVSQRVAVHPPDGAYLIVLPQSPGLEYQGNRAGPGISQSIIESVAYKDGHTCQPEPEPLREGCLPVGFSARSPQAGSHATLEAPITVHVVRAPRSRGSSLARITFVSHRAITSGHAYYSAAVRFTPRRGCGDQGSSTATDTNIARGSIVTLTMPVPNSCFGRAHGTVTYVERNGPAGPAPIPGLPGQARGQSVGTFTLTVP